MGLVERLRPTLTTQLPSGTQLGFRWSPLARQRRTCVGVDIGAGSLKVAQVRWFRQGPRLENYAVVPLPPGLMEEGAVAEPSTLGDLVRCTLTGMGLTQTNVGSTIGGPAIIMRYINLPRVAPEEMRSAMRFEAPQHLPVPEDQLLYDFTPVPEAAGVPEHQMAVFLAGTHKKLVDSHLAALSRAGLRPNAIELDCLALLRALQWIGLVSHTSQLPLVLLDFGEVGTRISVIRYGVPMLSRTIPTGLHHLRTAVADTLQVSIAEAEMALRLKGIRNDPALSPAVDPWMSSLMEAIGRSIEFFLIQNRGATLERVFLVGGGATLPNLPDALAAHLKTVMNGRQESEQIRVQPVGLAGFDINPDLLPGVNNFGPLLMTALGSALRGGTPE